MSASKNYEDMPYEELEAARQELMRKMFDIGQEQGKIVAVINARNAKYAAEQKFVSMGEDEKKEMTQLIMGAGGIKSKEEMGKL